MEYMDPIETARRILAGEPLDEETTDVVEETTEEESSLFFEEDELEEAKSKNEDDEDGDDDDEDEDEVEEGKMPPWLKKKNGKKDKDDDDDDEDDVDEAYLKANKDKTLDTKSEEDKDLYQDADGKGAKVAKPTGANAGKNKGTIKTKPSSASGKVETPKGVKEHVALLFNGEDLSEDFKIKAETIFETAISQRVEEVETELREQHEAVLAEHTETITKELSEKLDDYLGYVVEQWMEENSLAVETGIRADVAENFLSGLKVLFESNYVEVPDDKYDLVETLAQSVVDLEEKLQEELHNNIALAKEVKEKTKDEVFAEVTEDLVDTDVEKVKTLTENIEFEDADTFRKKVEVIKENYLTDIITENADDVSTSDSVNTSNSPVMNAYVDSLTRTSKVKSENTVR